MSTSITTAALSYDDLHRALGLPAWVRLVAVEASQADQRLVLVLDVPSETLPPTQPMQQRPELSASVEMVRGKQMHWVLVLSGFVGSPA